MTELRVSAEARRDLRHVGRMGVRDHGRAASAAHIAGFRRLFGLLRDQPFAGQEWVELGMGIRSLSHRPHRILYRVDGDTVLIVRVVHQSRDMQQALQDDH